VKGLYNGKGVARQSNTRCEVWEARVLRAFSGVLFYHTAGMLLAITNFQEVVV